MPLKILIEWHDEFSKYSRTNAGVAKNSSEMCDEIFGWLFSRATATLNDYITQRRLISINV